MRAGSGSWLFPVFLLGAIAAPAGAQQSPDDALAAGWDAVCAGAVSGSDLQARCAGIFAGGPGSREIAAAGNFLGEIPGQGRVATRDGAPDDAAARTALAAGWALFASADAGRLKRRDGVNEAPFDGDTGRIAAGVDWAPASGWQIALLLTHARDELDYLRSDGNLRTRFTGALMTTGWRPAETLSIDAYVGRLDGDYEIRRVVDYVLPSGVAVRAAASASPEARRDLAGAGVTWSPATGAWEWQFGAGVDWQRTRIDPFSESGGAGLAIELPGRLVTSRRGRVDATLARTWSTSWGVWQPFASLGWRREYANPSRPVPVVFLEDAGRTPVVFATDDADRDWAELGVGASFVFAGGHSAFVELRQRAGHAFLQERLLAVGWRVELP